MRPSPPGGSTKGRGVLSRFPSHTGSCAGGPRRNSRSRSGLRGTIASTRAAGVARDGFHTTCGAAWNSWSPPLQQEPWRTWISDEHPPEATGIPKARFSPRPRDSSGIRRRNAFHPLVFCPRPGRPATPGRMPLRPGNICNSHARFVSTTASRAGSRSDQGLGESGDLTTGKHQKTSIPVLHPRSAVRKPGR